MRSEKGCARREAPSAKATTAAREVASETESGLENAERLRSSPQGRRSDSEHRAESESGWRPSVRLPPPASAIRADRWDQPWSPAQPRSPSTAPSHLPAEPPRSCVAISRGPPPRLPFAAVTPAGSGSGSAAGRHLSTIRPSSLPALCDRRPWPPAQQHKEQHHISAGSFLLFPEYSSKHKLNLKVKGQMSPRSKEELLKKQREYRQQKKASLNPDDMEHLRAKDKARYAYEC
ncbi:hypothetical protein U9M48_009107 [Paspalum notatum var. saurae]|uniref:Uncharacterized protein n=1 Tax=Paspalum notatum var. saurae TaxID=547442 RepID=A0AAQ3SRM1_PASNO